MTKRRSAIASCLAIAAGTVALAAPAQGQVHTLGAGPPIPIPPLLRGARGPGKPSTIAPIDRTCAHSAGAASSVFTLVLNPRALGSLGSGSECRNCLRQGVVTQDTVDGVQVDTDGVSPESESVWSNPHQAGPGWTPFDIDFPRGTTRVLLRVVLETPRAQRTPPLDFIHGFEVQETPHPPGISYRCLRVLPTWMDANNRYNAVTWLADLTRRPVSGSINIGVTIPEPDGTTVLPIYLDPQHHGG